LDFTFLVLVTTTIASGSTSAMDGIENDEGPAYLAENDEP
jgi:hypothetical protein